MVKIHESAWIDEGAVIGEGVSIWHCTHVRSGARIGRDTSIGQCCHVDGVIGERCKIQNGVNLYEGVEIGDEVFVGPCVTFTNDLYPKATGAWEITPTVVEDGVSIGAGATIVCGVTIGAGAVVAAGAVVTKNVSPGDTVAGVPATSTSSPNEIQPLKEVMDKLQRYQQTRSPEFNHEKWAIADSALNHMHGASAGIVGALYDGVTSLLWQQMDDFEKTQLEIKKRFIDPASTLIEPQVPPEGDRTAWLIMHATSGLFAPYKHVKAFLSGMKPCFVYIYGTSDPNEVRSLIDMGHTVRLIRGTPEMQIAEVRGHCVNDKVGTLITDTEKWISFATFCLRSAKLQLFLSPGIQCLPCDHVLLPFTQNPLVENTVQIGSPMLPEHLFGDGELRPIKKRFGCMTRYEKMTGAYLEAVKSILDEVPGSEFLVFGQGSVADNFFIAVKDKRIRLMGVQDAHEALSQIDVYLDTFPLCGGVSVWEAMGHRVPVVTLDDDSLSSWNQYKPFVVPTRDDYVSAAVTLMMDGVSRQKIINKGHDMACNYFDTGAESGRVLDETIKELNVSRTRH